MGTNSSMAEQGKVCSVGYLELGAGSCRLTLSEVVVREKKMKSSSIFYIPIM